MLYELYELHKTVYCRTRDFQRNEFDNMSCATSVTCYFFYFGFINLIFLNIKFLSSDFYFINGIGLVLTKQCHFIEN
jgi:phosphate starvation-inducible membrane PsiE